MKKLLSLLLVAIMLFGLVACASTTNTPAATDTPAASEKTPAPDTTETEQPAEEQTPAEETEAPAETPVERVALNVAYMPNYASMWVLMAAKDGGYFDEEGLDVTLFEFADGPTEIAAMESGSIDLAYIGDGAHRLPANGNCKIFCYSHIGDAEMVIGLTSAGINSLADLKGKKVGYASGTSSETMLQRALADAGLTMDDIVPYDIETSNMVTAMVSGSLDACSTWSPNTWQILNEMDDAVRLCSPLDYIDETVALSSFVVMENWATEKHDVLIRFTRALLKAMDFGAPEENRPQVSQWIATQLAADVATVETQDHDGNWLTGKQLYEAVKDGTIKGYYQVQLNQMVANEKATADVQVEDYVLFDVMLEAAASLYD